MEAIFFKALQPLFIKVFMIAGVYGYAYDPPSGTKALIQETVQEIREIKDAVEELYGMLTLMPYVYANEEYADMNNWLLWAKENTTVFGRLKGSWGDHIIEGIRKQNQIEEGKIQKFFTEEGGQEFYERFHDINNAITITHDEKFWDKKEKQKKKIEALEKKSSQLLQEMEQNKSNKSLLLQELEKKRKEREQGRGK